MSAIFEDMFDVKNIDDEKFDRVSRIKAQSHTYNAEIEVDINTEIYPIGSSDTLRIAIASAADANEGYQGEAAQPGIIDDYEYAMYGKVYKKMNKTVGTETVASRTIIYVSFGGLLMKLEAQRSDVDEAIRLDDRLYLLMRKVY
ncbi:RNA polymerase subunit, putative [Perkinsus marinus ATCC 50983]|uniref:DNA-directed RNA polymerases I, II, and III subunit RPABC3 n=2 Tax=Perkinsus marinus (strain ATCC 50983 / TXsc) TaxID=423536 RepID=C5L8P4_PERM5|nr:RNA polymerase subunit, putative [Perkinsus marinus ATCC 50983]EER06899.1 RNA polymerase subunit, putative [Perkinsus marinus ATCC 50983]|eukprot:XP_002775083.1 RNA polymerase subunit, putative [Perkinsus marinus ATCC 50983]